MGEAGGQDSTSLSTASSGPTPTPPHASVLQRETLSPADTEPMPCGSCRYEFLESSVREGMTSSAKPAQHGLSRREILAPFLPRHP